MSGYWIFILSLVLLSPWKDKLTYPDPVLYAAKEERIAAPGYLLLPAEIDAYPLEYLWIEDFRIKSFKIFDISVLQINCIFVFMFFLKPISRILRLLLGVK